MSRDPAAFEASETPDRNFVSLSPLPLVAQLPVAVTVAAVISVNA